MSLHNSSFELAAASPQESVHSAPYHGGPPSEPTTEPSKTKPIDLGEPAGQPSPSHEASPAALPQQHFQARATGSDERQHRSSTRPDSAKLPKSSGSPNVLTTQFPGSAAQSFQTPMRLQIPRSASQELELVPTVQTRRDASPCTGTGTGMGAEMLPLDFSSNYGGTSAQFSDG